MILLELSRGFREQNDNSIHSACNRAHSDASQDKSDHETNDEGINLPIATGVGEPVRRNRQDDTNRTSKPSDHYTHEKERVANQIIGDDSLPSTIFEQSKYILSSLTVAISIQANIYESCKDE